MPDNELQNPRFIDLHQAITQTPQDHLSIDLLGPYNATSQGNIYVLLQYAILQAT